MILYQHAYGRVATGYAPAAPGYQLAALSPDLERERGAIERLNRLSFFTGRPGAGAAVRYSFCRPTPGLVAFGAVRWARDRAGAVGAFAHHFVGETAALIESGLTPVRTLDALRPHFLAGEDALGEDRRLATLETVGLVDPGAEPPNCGDPAVWEVLDTLLATPRGERPGLPTPMVVRSDAEVWPFLHALFRCLYPQRAAETTFSTRFVEAGDFAAAFRLVVVPEPRDAPTGASPFRVLGRGEPPPAADPRQGPYVACCRRHPQVVREMRRFFDLSHREPGNLVEGGRLLDTVLRTSAEAAAAFRFALESEAIPRRLLLGLLLGDAARADGYWRRGESVPYDDLLDEVVCADVWVRLPVLLRCAAERGDPMLREAALAALAMRVRTVPGASGLLAVIDERDREAFVALAARQSTPELLGLTGVILPGRATARAAAAEAGHESGAAPTTGAPAYRGSDGDQGRAATTGAEIAVRVAVGRRLCDELAARLLSWLHPDGLHRASGEARLFGVVELGLRRAAEATVLSDFVTATLALVRWSRQRGRRPGLFRARRPGAVVRADGGDDARLVVASYGRLDRRQYRTLLRAVAPLWTHWDRTAAGPVATLRHPAHADEFERWALGRRPAFSFSDQVTLLVDLCRLRDPDDPCDAIVDAIDCDASGARLATHVLRRLASPGPARPPRRPARPARLVGRLQEIADRHPWRRFRKWAGGAQAWW